MQITISSMKYIKQFIIKDIVLNSVPLIHQSPRPTWQGPSNLVPLTVGLVDDVYVLLDGYRRLKALKQESVISTAVWVLDAKMTSEELFLQAFRLNVCGLDLCDYLHAVHILYGDFAYKTEQVRDLLMEYVPGLLTARDVSNILLVHQVYDRVWLSLLTKKINLEQVVRLIEQTEGADFECMLDMILQTGMNHNELKQILKYGSDVMLRDSSDWESLFTKVNWIELLEEDDRRVRLKRLMHAMIALRFPIRTQSEQDIKRIYKALGSPAHLKIALPDNLEGAFIQIKMDVQSVDEMMNVMEWLHTKKDILDDLFQWI